ncbi:MAG: ferric reductase-like transmembrane domain-containing protein [Acidimicrobiia bacterium]
MLAALDPRTWWFVARAGGLVAWALLALAVVWGLALSTKTFGRNPKPAWLLDLHRHLGGLAVVFTGVHLAALVADTYVAFGWRDLFLPFASAWKPRAVAWGIVAFYLLMAVEVTSLLQRHLPRTWWRRVHMLSFPLFVVATAHLVTAGTDAGATLTQWVAVAVSTVVAFLILIRLIARREPTRPRPPRAKADEPEARLSRLRVALPADEG